MMKWYDYNFWKAVVSITLAMYVSLLIISCGTPKTVTKQTYLKDELNERKFDSLFTIRMSHTFEQWLHYQKREIEKNTKDSSYVKDSTATRFDAQGKKIGEDRLHFEYHSRTEKDTQRLLDSIRQYKTYKDSISIYKYKCDSLMKVKKKSDTKIIKEPVSKMQNILSHIGVLICLTILVIVIYIFLYVYERKHS
nr:MAG TPA: holin [Bacteriophage sp.]